jgi:hypothetical protein
MELKGFAEDKFVMSSIIETADYHLKTGANCALGDAE